LAAGLLVMAWFIRDRRKHRTTLPPSPAHNP
jgi:hypothetical protein